jgi:hypothetical protein
MGGLFTLAFWPGLMEAALQAALPVDGVLSGFWPGLMLGPFRVASIGFKLNWAWTVYISMLCLRLVQPHLSIEEHCHGLCRL